MMHIFFLKKILTFWLLTFAIFLVRNTYPLKGSARRNWTTVLGLQAADGDPALAGCE